LNLPKPLAWSHAIEFCNKRQRTTTTQTSIGMLNERNYRVFRQRIGGA
jgi:hypothetical protein